MVHIESKGLDYLFSELSLSNDIPMGVEVAWDNDDLVIYHMDIENGTLSDVLTQFVNRHGEYDWEIKDGVVNVFPRDYDRDVLVNQLLQTDISRFSIEENSTCSGVQASITADPGIKTILEIYGLTPESELNSSGFGFPTLGRHFALQLSNINVRSILNKVVKESPIAKVWCVRQYTYNQTLSIRVDARSEDIELRERRTPCVSSNVNVTQYPCTFQ
jgi:hypothetical protein